MRLLTFGIKVAATKHERTHDVDVDDDGGDAGLRGVGRMTTVETAHTIRHTMAV